MEDLRLILRGATLLWGVTLCTSFLPGRWSRVQFWCLMAATVCGVVYLAGRYWLTFPMMPMFMGAVGVAPVMSCFLVGYNIRRTTSENMMLFIRYGVALCFVMSATALMFPKDFYLPFLKTALIYPHAMLIAGVLGRVCLMLAGLWAIILLTHKFDQSARDCMTKMMIWGFAFWTVSLFAGEMWCYAGWGVPIVWEDATIITSMATWFFYVALIHLHLMARWSYKIRAAGVAFGIVMIVVFNCIIEFGPYRPLFQL